jgi:hypothetical protein
MDPYLEDPAIWSGVHAALLAAIFERLGPAVRPKYAVRYEERVYVTSEEDPGLRMIVPDLRVIERDPSAAGAPPSDGGLAITTPIRIELAEDEIHEKSLIIIDVKDRSVVTVIELLSPTNKTLNSFGRESFLRTRREALAAGANWLEIDLLRDGARTANLARVPQAEYQVYLSRASRRREGFVWPIQLEKRLPVIAIPLRGDDPDVPLDLQAMLNAVIERGSYDLETDYQSDPIPPLTQAQTAWARQICSHHLQS